MRVLWPNMVCLWFLAAGMPAVEFHVAPTGSATGTGSAGLPFGTIERAREAVAEARQAGLAKEGATVWLHGGLYERNRALELGPADGGSPGAPVIYRNVPGERPVLSGAVSLPRDAFRRVTDGDVLSRLRPEARRKVQLLDLNALRITDYGQLPLCFAGAAPAIELFYGGRRMELARWPNSPEWTAIGRVLDPGTSAQEPGPPRPGTFRYADPRHGEWLGAEDAYLYGYWRFDHAAEAIRIERIDPDTRVLALAAPHVHGIGRDGSARRYYAFNLLEELDAPGEYYIDRSKGLLYFWPPKDRDRTVRLTMLSAPLLRVADTTDIRIEGIAFEHVRDCAVEIRGSERILLAGCTVRHAGGCGVSVEGGRDCRIDSCDVHDTGTDGIRLAGGDAVSLVPSGHRATNNHVHHVGCRQLTGTAAMRLRGVGLRADHNLLHDAPRSAILCDANDCLIEYNEIHGVCIEAEHCGAFQEGGNPARQGTTLRYNFWHHIGMRPGDGNGAVRLDDGQLGETVFGNVFYRIGGGTGAIFTDGGYGNTFENNLFVECDRPVGHVHWSDERWRDHCEGRQNEPGGRRPDGDADVASAPHSERYPSLRDFSASWQRPRRNTARLNVAVGCGALPAEGESCTAEANLELVDDPGFANARKLDFLLVPDSPVFARLPGFRPIPFALIGLRRSAWREERPVRHQPASRPAPSRPVIPRIPPEELVVHPGATPAIDGGLREWQVGGGGIPLRENPSGRPCRLPSRAWLRWNQEALFVAFDNGVSPEKPLLLDGGWGHCDGVEVSLARGSAPVALLRGYAAGRFESSAEASGNESAAERAGKGVAYAAEIVSPERWTCEWSIPWSALGIAPGQGERLHLNLCVRKTANDEWVLLRATGAATWAAAEAAVLVLDGVPPPVGTPAREPAAVARPAQPSAAPVQPQADTAPERTEEPPAVADAPVLSPPMARPEPPSLKPPVAVRSEPAPRSPARLGPPIPPVPSAEPDLPKPESASPALPAAIQSEPARPESIPVKPPVMSVSAPAPSEPGRLGPPISPEPAPPSSPEPTVPTPPAAVPPAPAPAEPAKVEPSAPPQPAPAAEPDLPRIEPAPLKPPVRVLPESGPKEPSRLGPPIRPEHAPPPKADPPKADPPKADPPKPDPPKADPPKPDPPKPDPPKPDPPKPDPPKPDPPAVAPPIVVESHVDAQDGAKATLGPPLAEETADAAAPAPVAKPSKRPADMPAMRISPPEKLAPAMDGATAPDDPSKTHAEPVGGEPKPRASRWPFWRRRAKDDRPAAGEKQP